MSLATQPESNENVTELQAYGPKIDLPEGVTATDVMRVTALDKSTVSRGLRGLLKAHTQAYLDIQVAVDKLALEAEYGIATPESHTPTSGERIDQKKGDKQVATTGQRNDHENQTLPTFGKAVNASVPTAEAPLSHGQSLLAAFLGIAVERQGFGVVTGPSGAGKSFILRRFIGDNPDCLYLKARARMSISDLLHRLCGLFQVARSGSCDQRLANCLDAADGRLLVIDEADLLVAGRRPNLVSNYIEVFRELHEAGCAVILIGLPVLSEQISRCCETYVFRRIRLWHRLPTPTKTELERFWLHVTDGIPNAAGETRRVVQDALKLGLFGYLVELSRHSRDFHGDVAAARTLLFSPEV